MAVLICKDQNSGQKTELELSRVNSQKMFRKWAALRHAREASVALGCLYKRRKSRDPGVPIWPV